MTFFGAGHGADFFYNTCFAPMAECYAEKNQDKKETEKKIHIRKPFFLFVINICKWER